MSLKQELRESWASQNGFEKTSQVLWAALILMQPILWAGESQIQHPEGEPSLKNANLDQSIENWDLDEWVLLGTYATLGLFVAALAAGRAGKLKRWWNSDN